MSAARLVLHGSPRTKKNSGRIINAGGRPRLLPSKQYAEYEQLCLVQIMQQRRAWAGVAGPVNLRCVYYMETRRRVDLVNLLEATCDILVAGGVLPDDNAGVIVSVDGSRVRYDKGNPRVEIEITTVEV